MRSILSLFGIYVLAVLLAGTFPVGAGDPVHGGALYAHPAFPHVHTATRDALAASPNQTHLKVGLTPAFDASAGGATEVPTTALTPPVPRAALGLILGPERRLFRLDPPRRMRFVDPPPDPPPPTSLA